MSTIKISALNDLNAAPAADDKLVIVDTSASETKRIDINDLFTSPSFSGNVGIGETAPNNDVHVSTSTNGGGITIQRDSITSGDYGQLGFNQTVNSAGTPNVWIRGYRGATFETSYMTFGTGGAAGSERARIDSSGNLLVGKTSTALNTVGHEINATGTVYHTADGNTPLLLNRKTSDGDILKFYKDGISTGGISASAGSTVLTSSGSTLIFLATDVGIQLSSTQFRPFTADDATIDLGASAQRFKNLYLSGGVVFGSTGGAVTSKTLDDYEEGTWTPEVAGTTTAGTATYLLRTARYTKIGNRVCFTCFVAYSSLTGTGNLLITGLPFTCAEGFSPVCAVKPVNLTFSGQLSAAIGNATTDIRIEYFSSGTTGGSVAVDADAYLYVSGHYMTS